MTSSMFWLILMAFSSGDLFFGLLRYFKTEAAIMAAESREVKAKLVKVMPLFIKSVIVRTAMTFLAMNLFMASLPH